MENSLINKLTEPPKSIKAVAYVLTSILAITCLIPLLLVISISFTDEQALAVNGYSLIPSKFSLDAYKYLFGQGGASLLRSYGVSISVAVLGTLLGLLIMTLLGYVLSRKYFVHRQKLALFVFFTMLFHGGMVSSYIINTQLLHLKDTFLVLILVGSVAPMYIMIIRTFLQTNVPDSVVESAKIDGANEIVSFWKIVLPMAKPVLATIGLFVVVGFWNNWNTSYMYINNRDDLVPLQLMLKRIETQAEYMATAAAEMSGADADILKQEVPAESMKMALVVVVILPIMMAYPFFSKYFVKGITVGAVKG